MFRTFPFRFHVCTWTWLLLVKQSRRVYLERPTQWAAVTTQSGAIRDPPQPKRPPINSAIWWIMITSNADIGVNNRTLSVLLYFSFHAVGFLSHRIQIHYTFHVGSLVPRKALSRGNPASHFARRTKPRGWGGVLTCHGQFPGFASTPPITRDIGDTPHPPGIRGSDIRVRAYLLVTIYKELAWTLQKNLKLTATPAPFSSPRTSQASITYEKTVWHTSGIYSNTISLRKAKRIDT